MPRNPNKQRCAIPNCSNWAMRPDPSQPAAQPGRPLCRSHRDHLLGPRGGGAQPGNLNAVKTGERVNAFSGTTLIDLARQCILHPADTPLHILELASSIHARTHDPIKTTAALVATLNQVTPALIELRFQHELYRLLDRLPAEPQARQNLCQVLTAEARRLPPSQRVKLVRTLASRVDKALERVKQNSHSKTSTGTGGRSAGQSISLAASRPGAVPAGTFSDLGDSGGG